MAATAATNKPFAQALRELLVENDYVKGTGDPNWHAFHGELDGFVYETLRKVIAGERSVTPAIMEECARVLRVKPEYFAEYRIWQARRQFDVNEVGFDAALENLDRWAAEQATETKRVRRRRGA
jgi:hypothetical protein